MNKIKTIVIDDEFFNRGLITMLIARSNVNFEVIGEAESVNEGFKLISEFQPEVVFLDIKMPDGSGFDLLKRFTDVNFEVVFITGFDQYAIHALEYNALDYVLKPVDLDKFKSTLDRVQQKIWEKREDPAAAKRSEMNKSKLITKIPLQQNGEIVLVPANEIQYVLKEKNTLFFKHKSEIINTASLVSDLETILEGSADFVKISDNCFVNLGFIADCSSTDQKITMKDGRALALSSDKKTKIKMLMLARDVRSRG